MIYIRQIAMGYAAVGYTIEKLVDSSYYDGTSFVKVASPAKPPNPIAIPPGPPGIYGPVFAVNVATDPTAFPVGQYCVYIHRTDNSQAFTAYLIDLNPYGFYVVGGGALGSR